MQTFLPFADFEACARLLDYKRLGKQRVEAAQILSTLHRIMHDPPGKIPWENHPAVKMWFGFEDVLKHYYHAVVREWVRRGYRSTMRMFVPGPSPMSMLRLPPWLGDERLHASHRAALLAKEPAHYEQFGWSEQPVINYYWPR